MKSDLRREILRERLLLSPRDVQVKSSNIMQTLLGLECIKKAKCVMAYYAYKNEPDLLALAHTLLDMGKQVALPYITDDDDIIAVEYKGDTLLKSNVFGIAEPVIGSESEQAEPDIVLVPGVAFDAYGNRIGYGLGYFDRYLKQSDAYKIGICFDLQIVPHVEAQPYDVRMDMVITESQVLGPL